MRVSGGNRAAFIQIPTAPVLLVHHEAGLDLDLKRTRCTTAIQMAMESYTVRLNVFGIDYTIRPFEAADGRRMDMGEAERLFHAHRPRDAMEFGTAGDMDATHRANVAVAMGEDVARCILDIHAVWQAHSLYYAAWYRKRLEAPLDYRRLVTATACLCIVDHDILGAT